MFHIQNPDPITEVSHHNPIVFPPRRQGPNSGLPLPILQPKHLLSKMLGTDKKPFRRVFNPLSVGEYVNSCCNLLRNEQLSEKKDVHKRPFLLFHCQVR